MEEPTAVFLDYETVAGQIAHDATVGETRYRVRPPDAGCLHPRVKYGTKHRGMVNVCCMNPACHHVWWQVKVAEPVGA